ncbi:MAG TPA: DNA polymerase III subunit chi [Steroidobacteraceae bacterium]|nr:DNA polymerase III subunit chi [Steroidobacteraceae bacterium]
MDFYVLAGSEARARLKFACRIAEQACLADQRVFVWLDDAAELQSFDELLWTFADRSFVPHEIFSDAQQWRDTPVLLGFQAQPLQPFDLLLNLGSEVPAAAARAGRIAEIVDAEEPRRRAGRNRFRHYRDLGLSPETHNIAANDTP